MQANGNFSFLKDEYSILYNLATSAEQYLHSDPQACLSKLRLWGETLSRQLFSDHHLPFPAPDTFHNRLCILRNEYVIYGRAKDLLFQVKQLGNLASHQHDAALADAKTALFSTFKIAKWYYASYSEANYNIDALKFSLPEAITDTTTALQNLEKEYGQLQLKHEQLLAERNTEQLDASRKDDIKKRAQRAEQKIGIGEAETRKLIDEALRQAGWEVDTFSINYKTQKTVPQKGRNLAIAEWRCGGKWADYALFIGTTFYGIIEAKKYGSDISSDLRQAKTYAELADTSQGVSLLGTWTQYKVPFLFATNGRPYLEQLATKSGIWALDVRQPTNMAHALHGWYSPKGLQELYDRDVDAANDKLRTSAYDYLRDPAHLGLRPYQIEAIKAVEKHIMAQEQGKRALLAMATGTGKTRTVVGLAYRLIKANRFKRILFLTDRTLLATQALNTFTDIKVENINTFAEVYQIEGMKDLIPDANTRLHFATVQSLVKRLYYNSNDQNGLPVDSYDCIIVDEAHRGYLLDKEMDDGDWDFKNQLDYVSKYRMVLDYFDAYAIGLTATPALQTREIFGESVFTYSYREAVVDGFLIDHEPPIIIHTKLNQEGITWKTGEKPKVYDPETNSIEELGALDDELSYDVAAFNKQVLTESFNTTVVDFLTDRIDPEGEEKTLIFCANDAHADEVVKLLKESYEQKGALIGDNAVEKITGSIYSPADMVRNYKNEQWPNIAVTVDLLTTGIDVPQICHLVFMRRVKSRILYEQMIGRATRLCPEIDKECFLIYDAVKIYDTLQDYTQMRPVVVNPKAGFAELAAELDFITEEARQQRQVEQIIAKLHRKTRSMTDFQHELFASYTDGTQLNDWIERVKDQSAAAQSEAVSGLEELWRQMDTWRPTRYKTLVSEHHDELRDHERGYGEGNQKPADYLKSFEQYIIDHRAKIEALRLVCVRPTELSREALRNLRLKLDMDGYSTKTLQTAWKESRNEDIAADIIAFIRTAALGTTLESQQERVQRAMNKVYAMQTWTAIQKRWLGRIEKQLLAETILRVEDLDQEPFAQYGGLQKMEKVFNNQVVDIVSHLNGELYKSA